MLAGFLGAAASSVYIPTPHTLTITSSFKDIHINSYDPTGTYNQTEVRVKHWTTETIRGLVGFDFTALPAEAAITDATLRLYYFERSVVGVVGDLVDVLRVTQINWSESGSWNKYNGVTNWATPGGDYTVTDKATFAVPGSYGYIDINVTAMVQYFQANDGEVANFLLKFQDEGNPEERISIYSRTGVFCPQLVISYLA